LELSKAIIFDFCLVPMLMSGASMGGMPAIILYLLLQRLLVQGLTAGAVKE
jgi:ABC-type maltose transport system permease subunit